MRSMNLLIDASLPLLVDCRLLFSYKKETLYANHLNKMNPILRSIHDFISLLYPKLCLACSDNLPPFDELICLKCQYQLPKTGYHLTKENPFTEKFWGRVPIQTGASMYYFTVGSRMQQLIHQLKYEHKPEIGYKLGKLYGLQLKKQPHFQHIDAVVPVPLHPKKRHIRGYNQAEAFGDGLAEGLEVSHYPNALYRKVFTETQTKKSREERLENVFQAFAVAQADRLKGQHILLVDDVLTTGATLEACATKILEIEGAKVSLATIAIASD